MLNLTRLLNQDVTYWANAGIDAGGDFTFSSPVKISGRWETKINKSMDEDGEEEFARTEVWVDQEIFDADFIALGDQTGTSDPTVLDGEDIIEIKNVLKVPSVRGGKIMYKAIG